MNCRPRAASTMVDYREKEERTRKERKTRIFERGRDYRKERKARIFERGRDK
jgi:hypothetical protein